MKKVGALFALLTAILSCSVEDDSTPQTTNVAISTGDKFPSSTAGNNIQRGSLFAWISEIQVKAAHQSGYVSTTDFTLVDNGTAEAGTQFIMEDVQIGNNTFTASSKTNESERLETTQFPRPNGATNPNNPVILNQFNTLKARNPYAIYVSENPVIKTIIQGNAQEVNIPMKTNNSRIIVVFTTDDINGNNTENLVTITCYVNGVPFGPPATCNESMNATFYWSDQNSLAGKSIHFHIINEDRGTNDVYDSPAIVLLASNTHKMLYTIKDKKLIVTPM